jgi:hypothetical protein
MEGKINIINIDCEYSLAKDKTLPSNAYIVGYFSKGRLMYDIVQGDRISVFDSYYDEHKNVVSIDWTEGKINPRIYNTQVQKKTKK